MSLIWMHTPPPGHFVVHGYFLTKRLLTFRGLFDIVFEKHDGKPKFLVGAS
jgi:hypothetical protein